ncbi:hypothetical protein ACE45X_004353, partial [Escherichia coli]
TLTSEGIIIQRRVSHPALTSCLSTLAAESERQVPEGVPKTSLTSSATFPISSGVTFLTSAVIRGVPSSLTRVALKLVRRENNINIPSLWFVALTARHHQEKEKPTTSVLWTFFFKDGHYLDT